MLAILRKELREFLSDRRFWTLAVIVCLLAVVAALDGWQRVAQDEALRTEATSIERDTWLNQGQANPHDAAHFGRYALRNIPPLSAFDPGVLDFSGASIWMEAHFQNPSSLRRAENRLDSYPLASVTPAWVLSVVVPLVLIVFLFESVVLERNRGTLNLLKVQNARPFHFVAGKFSAAFLICAALAIFLLTLSCLPVVLHHNVAIDWLRVLVLVVSYLAAYMCFAGLVVFISTIAPTAHIALWTSSLLWISMVFGPMLVGQVAENLHPEPRDREFANAIQQEAQAPFWLGQAQYEEVAIYEAEIMTQHRALDARDLGLNRDALVLQAHERYANRVYDRLYGELYDTHLRHDAILRAASIFSPILALQRISRGIASTDLDAQLQFAEDAEAHRRAIIEKLNEDMLYNAGTESFRYVADRDLWQTVDDFVHDYPSLKETLQRYWFEVVCLLLWTLASFGLAIVAMRLQFEARKK